MARPTRSRIAPRPRINRPAVIVLEPRLAPAGLAAVQVNLGAVVEGDSGTTNLTIPVNLQSASTDTVMVDYTTVDGTATAADHDYQPVSGTLTFVPGEGTKIVSIPVFGDRISEAFETFTLTISNPRNATIARATGEGSIRDDDPGPASKTLAAVDAARLLDTVGAGVFTTLVSGATSLSVSRTTNPGQGNPAETRSVLEFRTQPIAAPSVTGAALQLSCSSIAPGQSGEVQVYGFADSDGVTLADATRPAVLLGTFEPLSVKTYIVPLDLTALRSLLAQGTSNIGIRLSSLVPSELAGFAGTSHSVLSPALILQVSQPTVSVDDVSAVEGDPATFTITLSAPLSTAVTVGYTTTDGDLAPHATVGEDYTTVHGTVTFAPGQTSKTVSVPTAIDLDVEPGETFGLLLDGIPLALNVARDFGTATLLDPAVPPPLVDVENVSVVEGDAGTTTATFMVTLSAPSQKTVTVNYATSDGNATVLGNDYVAASGMLTFAPGETSKPVSVTIKGDTTNEVNESFQIRLSSPTNAVVLPTTATASATIQNDDPAPTVSIGDVTLVEGNAGTTAATFTVTLSSSIDSLTLIVTTVDGTARGGVDFQKVSTSLLFFAGETSKTITVNILGDTYAESDETFGVTLTQQNGRATIVKSTGVGTIVDDDPQSGTLAGTASSWGYADDGDGNGAFDTFSSGGTNFPVRRVSSPVEDRVIFEFDVSRVVAGVVSSVTLDLNLTAFAAGSGPVTIGGFAGDGIADLADATRPVSALGTFQPTGTGRRTITLDRAAVLALLGGSGFLGLRLDAAATPVDIRVSNPTMGPANAPTLTFHADLPVAFGDAYTLDEDTPLVVPAAGVLANDFRPAGAVLSAVVDQLPAHGTLALAADGSFTYSPAPNFHGPDSFTYHVSDGVSSSNAATVTLTVGHVNHAPTAANDGYSTPEGATLTVAAPGVLANDADVDGDPITVVLVAGPAHGGLTFAADGSFVYTPAPTYRGSDSFTYRVSDGSASSGVATVNLTVTAVNHAPTSANDSVSVAGGSAFSLAASGVLGNDGDPDGDPLSAVLVANVAHGTLTLNANGSFSYTPSAGFSGTDSFTYQASDGVLKSPVATVTLNVGQANRPPTATGATLSAIQDTPAPVVLAAGDPDGDSLVYIVLAAPAHGTLSGNGANLTYTPAAGYFGPDSFTFKVNDGTLDSNTATVSIAVNARPTATGSQVTLAQGASKAVPLSAADPDGNPLAYIIVASPAHGTLSGTAPNLTYTPAPGYFGPDSFTFKASDGFLESNTAIVAILVNAPPTAAGASVTAVQNISRAVTLTAGDPNGDPLSYTIVAAPAHGSLSGTAPNLTYTPEPGYFGPDGFSFRVSDGLLDSDTAFVSIIVDAPPTATDAAIKLGMDSTKDITLDASDPDGDPLTYAVVSSPGNGTLSGTAPNLVYSPAPGYFGPDSFTFKVNDGLIDSPVATVSIVVDAPPTATDAQLATTAGTAKAVPLAALDPENDPLTYAIVAPPAHGTLSGVAPNLTYTPAAGFVGNDSFTFRVNDGTLDSNTATVSIAVGLNATTASVVASAAAPRYGQAVTFTATVTLDAAPAGSGPPAGSLQFRVDGADLGGPVTLSGGVATSVAIATLGAGNHAITAAYITADATLAGSTATLAGGLTVGKAPLTVTADALAKTYGAAVPGLSASFSGFVGGDDPTSLTTPVVLTTTATAASPVGTYAITAAGASSANYAITFAAGMLDVTPVPLTIAANAASKVYGQPNPPLTAAYTGFVLGDGPGALGGSLTFDTQATATSHVGHYAVTPGGLTSGNYTIAFVAGDLAVTPAPLTIVAVSKSKPFGAALPALTASYSGFVGSDTPASLDVPAALTTAAGPTSRAGSYAIVASGAADPDYAITFVAGTLTVKAAVQGDYNGDGKSDFALYYRTPGSSTGVWFVPGVTPASGVKFGSATKDIPVQGDFDGDGRTDIAVYRPSTAQWIVGGRPAFTFGQPNVSIPVPGRYDGLAQTQAAFYVPKTGQWFIRGRAKPIKVGGAAGDIPVPGDYDGTGRTLAAVYRPSTGQWFIQGRSQPLKFGGKSDIPVPGDYNGDGRTDLALFRPATTQWFVAGNPSLSGVRFGGRNSVPVPGDYDGTGRTQIAVFQPSTGQWAIAGHAQTVKFGGPHRVPPASPYAYRALSGPLRIQSAKVRAAVSLDFASAAAAFSGRRPGR